MMHGPCGKLNPNAPCTNAAGICEKRYPRELTDYTMAGNDSYPIYRRRPSDEDHNRFMLTNKNILLDNGWTVPHNLFLATKFDCHINVEIVSTVKAVKYLYKYVYKGPDRCTVELGGHVDEIKDYVDARYVSPPEAAWRLFGFDLYENKPAVYRLEVHTPDRQSVVFEDDEAAEDVQARALEKSTSLLGYFNAVREYPAARDLTYQEMPSKFVWHKSGEHKGTWTPRRINQQFPTIGRMYMVGRNRGEVYFVRLLLTQRRNVTGFDDLRTVDGTLYDTFELAARTMGLLDDDSDHKAALSDAVEWASAPQLRQLLSVILTTGCGDPCGLWETFRMPMIDDFILAERQRNPFSFGENALADEFEPLFRRALRDIDSRVQAIEGKRLTEYMPHVNLAPLDVPEVDQYVENERRKYDPVKLQTTVTCNVPLLNADQRVVYDVVTNAVATDDTLAMFVQGPGGTGKTFLLNTILASVRLDNKIALAVGSSGICATLLEGGVTAHSRLGLPFTHNAESTCNIAAESGKAQLLRAADLIVWDEITMAHKHLLEAFDRTMRNLCNDQRPWGGKRMLFAGDYAQCLAVVRRGNRSQIVAAQACMSKLWENVSTQKLSINMRAQTMAGAEREEQEAWSRWLLDLGHGRLPNEPRAPTLDTVSLPDDICLPPDAPFSALIDHVYPNLPQEAGNMDYFDGRAIVAPRNIVVDSVNEVLTNQIPGELHECLSADKVGDDHGAYFPTEYLNTLTPSGLPPHRLLLKEGMPIMLLRNLDLPNGLANGARLILRRVTRNVLMADITTGPTRGRSVLIPRIELTPSEQELPFKFTRRQFPIRPAFVMTINKCQGQTVKHVGVYLPKPAFTHGQLYVAASRAPARRCIKILAPHSAKDMPGRVGTFTRNVVYSEVLPR